MRASTEQRRTRFDATADDATTDDATAGDATADDATAHDRSAGLARRLLARRRQPARISRILAAIARRHDRRRRPYGDAGQDAGLRLPPRRSAWGRHLLCGCAFGKA